MAVEQHDLVSPSRELCRRGQPPRTCSDDRCTHEPDLTAGWDVLRRQREPDGFGLAVVELDGTEHTTGDADVEFPIQSISKVVALAGLSLF